MAKVQLVRIVVSGDSMSAPPSRWEKMLDQAFKGFTRACTLGLILLLFYILYEIGKEAVPAMSRYGLKFFIGFSWDASREVFGILPQIWGTLYSSFLALLIGGVFGVMVAVFLTQDFLPASMQSVFKGIVELLAAIPSVVYGLWGIFVLIPLIRPFCDWMFHHFSGLPFFSTSLSGPGMLPASLVLAIMILPTVAAVSQDALLAVPPKVKEAAYGLGTTRWEAILKVLLPTASHGIFGALVLGLGRALGETMALAMLVGNSNQVTLSLFSPANTLAALLALNFPEAGKAETQALMYAAIALMLITLIVNVVGQAIITMTSKHRSV